ncbi:1-acyl-sn-glycerol-3-phosphate acyltransferase [Sulfurimonas sp. HSL-3221]|uniref:lysophospholipid acyltransferase family protein n=1 Tax=Thiomicrolovo sulfuroxydans TaxID=2894755 RepID=UPI001E594353|nr:lysophospholipid acyltransferase family protein [Sulfurimonas sp. HSL-3221]UFS61737.1 1-acyl-sn-glycerol-3-phosphate acyltransferase [Sulfurimonas sp. HSL-3221]
MKILARINWVYSTLVIFTGLLLKILLYPFVPRPYASKIAAWFIRLLIFVHVRKVSEPDPEAQMYIINHQSELDIGVIESTTQRELAWVAKKELFEVPFFSLAVRLSREIPLERESKSALVALLKAAKERIDEGRIVCIFPEGTRSESGRMRRFKPGAKLIADKLGLTVQPVVLIHTARFFSTKRMTAAPGMITAIYLESFTADKSDKKWLETVQHQMQETYDRYVQKENV